MNEDEVVNRWGRTGLLRGITGRAKIQHTAYVLENQRLYIEREPSLAKESLLVFESKFKRTIIPIVRRVFPTLSCAAESRLTEKFNKQKILNVEFEPIRTSIGLDAECEATAMVAEQLRDAIDNFAFLCSLNETTTKFFVEGFGLQDGKIVLFYDLE